MKKYRYMTITGLLAALITIMTAYAPIPNGVNGGYIHFGDAFIYLGAILLPRPYALAAAAIGGGLADFLVAPTWILPTVIVKMLITLPFTSKNKRLLTKPNVIAPLFSAVITVVGYYLAAGIMFGSFQGALASIPGNFIQGAGSMVIFIIFAAALEKANFKQHVVNKQ